MFFTRTESNMRVFLGVLMALIVSGDEEPVPYVNGCLGGSVLLPCNCSNRDPREEFKWQKKGEKRVFILKENHSSFDPTFEGRTKLFLSENRDNCSILLTNITDDDQGQYQCRFHTKIYQKSYVNLTISESNNCENPGSRKAPAPPTKEKRHRYFKLIPIMLVLALSLLLWHRQTSHNIN